MSELGDVEAAERRRWRRRFADDETMVELRGPRLSPVPLQLIVLDWSPGGVAVAGPDGLLDPAPGACLWGAVVVSPWGRRWLGRVEVRWIQRQLGEGGAWLRMGLKADVAAAMGVLEEGRDPVSHLRIPAPTPCPTRTWPVLH